VTSQRVRGVAVVGPTASGKSALAHSIALASGGNVEIIAVDAMTVYRRMDIGTSKPTAEERNEVQYHCLDLVEPFEEFTVTQYQDTARSAQDGISDSGKRALYVGGTGLYGRAVIDSLEIPGQFPDVKQELIERASRDLGELYQELTALDPLAASRMEPTNERRIIRALEVTLGSGRPFSSYGEGLLHYGPVNIVQVGLENDFEILDAQIESRFRGWMEMGLLTEVEQLATSPRGLSKTARQAVGYKELLRHIEDGADLEECVIDAITQSRRLARRQRSWFRRDPRIEWFGDVESAAARVREVLGSIEPFVRD